MAPGGGQEPGRVAMGVPGSAEQGQGLCGQGNLPVGGALAAVDLALGVGQRGRRPAGRGLRGVGGPSERRWCRRPGGCQGGAAARRRRTSATRSTAGRRGVRLAAPAGRACAHACEDVRRDEAEAAGAEAPGGGGEAVDVCPVQAKRCRSCAGSGRGRCGRTGPAGGLRGQRLRASGRLCRGGGEPRSCVNAVGACGLSLRETSSGVRRKTS